jgi:membrane-associated protease RseP (regulator of RpoE activity)
MRKGRVFRAAAWGLALGLSALTSIAQASEAEQKKIEKTRVVMVDKDGKTKIWEGDGSLMKRGYLGVGLTELTPELRAHFGAPDDQGVMVSKVEPGSPAEKAGIKVGDVLTSVDGQEVETSWDVMLKVRGLDDGQQVPVEVWRNGKAQSLTVAVVEKERPELDIAPFMFKGGDGEPMVFHLDRDKLLKGWPKGKEGVGAWAPEGRLSTPREKELEKKLKELEKRLDELEKQLGKQKG